MIDVASRATILVAGLRASIAVFLAFAAVAKLSYPEERSWIPAWFLTVIAVAESVASALLLCERVVVGASIAILVSVGGIILAGFHGGGCGCFGRSIRQSMPEEILVAWALGVAGCIPVLLTRSATFRAASLEP